MTLRNAQRAAANGGPPLHNEKKIFLTTADTDLLTRIRDQADAVALGQYFNNKRPAFCGELSSFGYDRATCEDLIQDAALKILEKVQSADWQKQRAYSINQFAGYIFTTIRNGFISHARLASTRLTTPLFDTLAEAGEASETGDFGVTSDTLPNSIPTWDDPAKVVVSSRFEDEVFDAISAYIAQNPRTVVKHLADYAAAAMDDPDLTLRDHFKPSGKGEGNYKKTIWRGRKVLTELGLTRQVILDGRIPPALSPK